MGVTRIFDLHLASRTDIILQLTSLNCFCIFTPTYLIKKLRNFNLTINKIKVIATWGQKLNHNSIQFKEFNTCISTQFHSYFSVSRHTEYWTIYFKPVKILRAILTNKTIHKIWKQN